MVREEDLAKITPAIQRFFEKFVLKGQVLLDQVEQDPADNELSIAFRRYFEVYLQDVDCYGRDARVAHLREAYMRMNEK